MGRLIVLCVVAPLWAQTPLTLREAVALGLHDNKLMAASGAGVRAAAARMGEARAGALPKVNYAESLTRSNNPVFVFSSLLTEHQFTQQNFDLGLLNRPGFLDNFQSLVTVDQAVFDARQTRTAVRSAQIGRQMSAEEERRARLDVIAGIARAYWGELLGEQNLKAAQQAQRSAEADLEKGQSVHAAGMSTDADVLSIRVHLAAVSEQRIQRAADLEVARAALNDALGQPLDAPHRLTSELKPLDAPDLSIAQAETDASRLRPEARQTSLAAALAQTREDAARGSLLPRIDVHAAFEADRGQFASRAGANWLGAVSLRWNLFNGFSDKARIAEAAEEATRAEAERQRTTSALRLQVRRAYADLRAAVQRIKVAKASVDEAEESLRITRNRYEAGMSTVSDLLRNETAALESRTRWIAAVHDQRVAAAMLEYAAGRLTPDSEVLN
jgi:outer membrane protein